MPAAGNGKVNAATSFLAVAFIFFVDNCSSAGSLSQLSQARQLLSAYAHGDPR